MYQHKLRLQIIFHVTKMNLATRVNVVSLQKLVFSSINVYPVFGMHGVSAFANALAADHVRTFMHFLSVHYLFQKHATRFLQETPTILVWSPAKYIPANVKNEARSGRNADSSRAAEKHVLKTLLCGVWWWAAMGRQGNGRVEGARLGFGVLPSRAAGAEWQWIESIAVRLGCCAQATLRINWNAN